MPDALEAAFGQHRAMHRQKLVLVDQILAAPGCSWSEAELVALPLDDLTKMASLAAATPRPVSGADPVLALLGSDEDYAPCPPSPWG